jgi:site-specific DNA-methyltransferase (adenine-specific)
MQRVSKNQIIFGGNYFVEHLRNSSCWIVWDKDNGNTDFADCELAWCSFSSAVRRLKLRWNGMLQHNMKDKEIRIHPTQKPVRLFEWILEKYATQGQVIFDPFLGSGSSAIAAHNLGFEFIGAEREQSYFDSACKRIEAAQQQLKLGFV